MASLSDKQKEFMMNLLAGIEEIAMAKTVRHLLIAAYMNWFD